jgi:hypothetical protein
MTPEYTLPRWIPHAAENLNGALNYSTRDPARHPLRNRALLRTRTIRALWLAAHRGCTLAFAVHTTVHAREGKSSMGEKMAKKPLKKAKKIEATKPLMQLPGRGTRG